ncbi:GHKL domain-containing protein [Aeromicrobium sp. S22]|uniref:sensor histidine kinase n=1 Tax=Aeromicrobium sp. S22 TaxID=2662029 RepID=UPI00129D9F11|nr:sensor histidine kinase [Aeromicrobium sp. S22]MRK01584.1 GHKL domain-containing protein [Aeromicrobium sp. S22]
MWSLRQRRLTLAGQFLVLQLIVVGVVLAIVAVISLRQSTASFASDRGTQMRSVAENLANTSVVRDQVTGLDPAAGLAPAINRAVSLSGATDVAVADPGGIVMSSSDPRLIGTPAALGDSGVREGRGWTGDVDKSGRRYVAGHAPIIDDNGTLVGLALAEQRYPSVWARLTDAAGDLILYLGVGALLGAAGSWLVSRLVKRRTRGLEPHEFATLADHREALLHSIREGVIAVDTDGRVTMVNDGARELLGLDEDPVGRRVDQLGLPDQVASVLTGGTETHDVVLLVGDRVVVCNQRSASSRGEGIGTVTTMRDRTELVSMQSQLSSNLSITDTLRAQTHEFANQLHTISGLVQLREYDEVTSLVGTLTRRRQAISDAVTRRIKDRAVAALLIAKSSVAAEAGVTLTIAPTSSLPPLPQAVSADLTTIIGNLIDNAVDACKAGPDPSVRVDLHASDREVVLEVRDSGPGVDEEVTDAIFSRGFSTKPEVPGGRGIGLPLVRLVCRQRGGSVTVEPGPGAVFRVRLPVDLT